MSNSSDFLQEYLDSLLNDTPLGGNNIAAEQQAVADENTLKLAAGSNIAPLPNVSRSARAVSSRPYAEPIRTLNLRMPLPPVAEAAVSSPVIEKTNPAIETKSIVENKIDIEAPVAVVQPAVAEKSIVETKTLVEAQPVSKAEPIIEARVVVPASKKTVVEEKVVEETAVEEPVAEQLVESTSNTSSLHGQNQTDLATMAPPAAWLSNGRPQWAQQPFECLIFKAGGLQLAAPLVELGSIYPLEEDALTEIFGQTQWFMGLLPIKEYNVRAMNTGLVVMPERYQPAMREQYRYVISLFGSDWGLAVDSVVGTAMLDPERVRWRGERSKRPWLAGTLIDQMCALFDIAQLAWLFHTQDGKRAPR